MAKTADIQQAIWTEPWFLALNPNGKVLYLWAISTTHSNLSGLFTVAAEVIRLETGLTKDQFNQALKDCGGKLHYRPASGAVWVTGRVKHVRTKSKQVAKHIAAAFKICPEPELQAAFLGKYGKETWLKEAFRGVGLEKVTFESEAPAPDFGEATDFEQQLVSSLLRAFNVEANGVYSPDIWSDRIVACLRAHPDLTEKDHLRVVRTAFRNQWWKRTDRSRVPTPGVIWGTLEQFEKCVGEMREQASAPTKVDYEDSTEVLHA